MHGGNGFQPQIGKQLICCRHGIAQRPPKLLGSQSQKPQGVHILLLVQQEEAALLRLTDAGAQNAFSDPKRQAQASLFQKAVFFRPGGKHGFYLHAHSQTPCLSVGVALGNCPIPYKEGRPVQQIQEPGPVLLRIHGISSAFAAISICSFSPVPPEKSCQLRC